MPDEDSECEPPDPIPNSEVKPLSADGSVGLPHVRVGHRQAPNKQGPPLFRGGPFLFGNDFLLLLPTARRAACDWRCTKGASQVRFSVPQGLRVSLATQYRKLMLKSAQVYLIT